MPSSNLAVAPTILALAAEAPHERILDVGPGHGKYAVLCREYLSGVRVVDAVEAWAPYVKDFGLECLYDDVVIGDVMDLPPAFFLDYDLVLMVDVLEHLDHADGERFLQSVGPRVIVSTPANFFQNPEYEEVPPEKHRSLWTLDEMKAVRGVENAVESLGGIFARFAPLIPTE